MDPCSPRVQVPSTEATAADARSEWACKGKHQMSVTAFMVAGVVTVAVGEPTGGVVETRTVNLTQTVTVHDIQAGARQLRMWAPIPSDGAWQRVLDRRVVSAPGSWKVVRQADGRGDFVYAELADPPAGDASIVVECVVERQGVHFPIDAAQGSGEAQAALFAADLDPDAPLMEVDSRIQALADRACGDETDVARQAMLLLEAVSDLADHYSTNPNVPTCGRGAAGDCLDHGGGCCTDVHSLFIAMAHARGIPARIQYGYRLLDGREGKTYDPGYRCWVDFFVPGAGWIPTDIVASESAGSSPHQWGSLSSTRVWLWAGRSFELTPPADAGRIDTMLNGWAEIDGKPIDVLPATDGTPSRLRRTVEYRVLSNDRTEQTAPLPQ